MLIAQNGDSLLKLLLQASYDSDGFAASVRFGHMDETFFCIQTFETPFCEDV